MKQCLMPERCRRCGELFDLRFDFDNDSELRDEMKEEEHLCWKCRDR